MLNVNSDTEKAGHAGFHVGCWSWGFLEVQVGGCGAGLVTQDVPVSTAAEYSAETQMWLLPPVSL